MGAFKNGEWFSSLADVCSGVGFSLVGGDILRLRGSSF